MLKTSNPRIERDENGVLRVYGIKYGAVFTSKLGETDDIGREIRTKMNVTIDYDGMTLEQYAQLAFNESKVAARRLGWIELSPEEAKSIRNVHWTECLVAKSKTEIVEKVIEVKVPETPQEMFARLTALGMTPEQIMAEMQKPVE
jgi:hypothetical protein